MPYSNLLHPESLFLWQATVDPYLHQRLQDTHRQVWLSLLWGHCSSHSHVCCESWTIKNVECQRIDAFELWYWRRLLIVPWTVRRSNQSIVKEISPECSLEGLMLKLKLSYFGHQMWRTHSLETNLILGKIEGRRRRGWQRTRWLDWFPLGCHIWFNGHEFEHALRDAAGQGSLACCSPWGRRVGND